MSKDFFREAGPMTIGSRLRQTSDRLTQEAVAIYAAYGVTIEPRWFPVLYSLARQDGQTIAQLATAIGHSQASVSQIVKEMHRRAFVLVGKPADDARKTVVTLTETAGQVLPALNQQIADVSAAVDALLADMQHNLWLALDELDYLLDQQPLLARVQQQRRQRERQRVQIVPFSPQYADAFRQLNHEWITAYFELEAADHEVLDHPEDAIIKPGGCILMALYDGEPVGTCALIPTGERTYELAKMAVTPRAQGKHVGWLLGQAIIEQARALGAETLFLDSNTKLEPAIRLYQKLGFRRLPSVSTHYKRTNIHMELTL